MMIPCQKSLHCTAQNKLEKYITKIDTFLYIHYTHPYYIVHKLHRIMLKNKSFNKWLR